MCIYSLFPEMLSKFTEAEKLDGCIYTCDECNSKYTTNTKISLLLSV